MHVCLHFDHLHIHKPLGVAHFCAELRTTSWDKIEFFCGLVFKAFAWFKHLSTYLSLHSAVNEVQGLCVKRDCEDHGNFFSQCYCFSF